MRRHFLAARVASVLVLIAALGLTPGAEAPSATRIEVTIHEGTNMAAALSPDGRTLAIDALGRIWTLPVDGGAATAITDPFGDARQPTWSPDGSRIAFQAYWDGNYDIWAVRRDGTGLERLTSGPFDDREPHWSPDGARVVFSSDRGGSYGIWEVELAGGAMRVLADDEDNEYQPAYAPDGSRVAFVSDARAGDLWVRSSGGAVRALVDLADGEAYAPSWSRDGSRLTYNVQRYGESALHVVSASGDGDHVISSADEDVFGFRPAWLADGRVLYTADGVLRTRPAGGGGAVDVPFSATVTLERPVYRKALRSFDASDPQPVRGIVSPAVSPDGTRVAFSALGDLWIMPIGAEPERLTDDPWVEVDPMWSPDGTRLAYASDREGTVDVWIREVATGRSRRLTQGGGGRPVWSPDGREIAYAGGSGPSAGIRVISVQTGASRMIRSGLNNPGRPTWSPDGGQVGVSALWRYSTRFREGVNKALLIRLPEVAADDGAGAAGAAGAWPPAPEAADERRGVGAVAAAPGFAGPRSMAGAEPPLPAPVLQERERWIDFLPHASVGSRGNDGPIWSPDGDWIAYVSAGVLWAIPVTHAGDPVGPPVRLNNELTADPTWSGDSRSLVYLTTDRLRRVWLETGRIEDVPVPLTWQRTVPEGRRVVHAGSLWDGVSDGLRRSVDVVIDANRIVRVADHDPALHRGEVVDAGDGVLAPGLIEMHTHGGLAQGEAAGRTWLAYGVTSVRKPVSDPYDMVEAREAVGSGRRLGPRTFGTGTSIDGSRIYYAGAPALSSSAQVELQMEQARALGFDVIKTYVRLPDAVQRRVIEDAHALGIPVTSHELYPAVAYGVDGVEHVRGTSRRGYSTKVSEMSRSYQDVEELLVRSGMQLTPTVGLYGLFGVLAADVPSLLDDARIRAFAPDIGRGMRSNADLATVRRMGSGQASLARRVAERGGVVVVGTDFGPQGMTLHAEMEALVRYGGMRAVDVLRSTTSVPAEAMGYGDELGAVREGMLADLVVYGSSPLDDIGATRDVRLVVKDGRVHTMEELLRRPAG